MFEDLLKDCTLILYSMCCYLAHWPKFLSLKPKLAFQCVKIICWIWFCGHLCSWRHENYSFILEAFYNWLRAKALSIDIDQDTKQFDWKEKFQSMTKSGWWLSAFKTESNKTHLNGSKEGRCDQCLQMLEWFQDKIETFLMSRWLL